MRKSSLGSFTEAFSGFPHSSVGKESACNAGDMDLIPDPGRSHMPRSICATGNPLQCSCLENPRDGGAWWAARRLWGRTKSDTTEATYQQQQQYGVIHVHRVGDAIQPSHPLSSPSPPALNLSQFQGLFQ